MINWLIISIASYLFFALASLGDKIILKKTPKPKLYAFYVSFLSIFAIFILPFVHFNFPDKQTLIWALLDAIVYVWGLYVLFLALEKYDVSRTIPTIGAIQPVLVFILALFFWPSASLILSSANLIAFFLLLIGGVLISVEKNFSLTKDSLFLSFLTALLFSLDFIFQKFVFEGTDLISGFILMRLLGVIVCLVFLLDKEVRRDIRKKEGEKTGIVFVLAQAAGGLATICQSWAIKIVPVAYLAIINALKGIQYVFLFMMTIICSFFIPKLLKESLSRKVLVQKLIAIFIIALGLFILIQYGNFIY
jgi:uncharacterized membrane protein